MTMHATGDILAPGRTNDRSSFASPQQIAEGALRHAVYESFPQVQHLRSAWDELASSHGELFSSYDWCEIWWRHFQQDRQLQIHTLHEGARLVGVLPLFRETLKLAGVRLRIVRLVACDYTIDAAGLAIEPPYAEPFVQRVLDHLSTHGRWDVLQLGPLRSYVEVADPVARACAEHSEVRHVIIGRQDNWLTLFELPDTYQAYLQSLNGEERRDTARRERKLREGRQVEITAIQEPAQVPAAMDTLIQWHQRLWTGKGQRGQFLDWPGFEQFHRDVAQRLSESGRLLLVTLQVDGQMLGAAYGYHFGPRSHAMIRGYCDEPPWRSYALGRLLHCHMTEQAIRRGSNVLDDGRGVFEYKLRLNGRLHGERSITVVRRGWGSRLRFWLGLRMAYAIHVVYGRIWFDSLAPRLGVRRPLRRAYIRGSFLAQLFRRASFRLFGGARVQESRCLHPLPEQRSSKG